METFTVQRRVCYRIETGLPPHETAITLIRPERKDSELAQPLETYLSRYRKENGGRQDLLWAFRLVEENFGCRRVLYPGSYLDVTPSLVFPEVCYVDSVKGIAPALADPALRDYVNSHKDYEEDAVIQFHEADYRDFASEPAGSFDLLISLNAGSISLACRHFLKPDGLLLANNGHYDANRAYVDPTYRLVAALEDGSLNRESLQPGSSPYFHTARGEELTPAMVESDAKRPPSRARFRPSREADVYLFQSAPAVCAGAAGATLP